MATPWVPRQTKHVLVPRFCSTCATFSPFEMLGCTASQAVFLCVLTGRPVVVTSLHHMDLYRLQGGADLGVLDIPNVMKTSVCLIEWPDRLGKAQPGNRLGENVLVLFVLKRPLGVPLPPAAPLHPRVRRAGCVWEDVSECCGSIFFCPALLTLFWVTPAERFKYCWYDYCIPRGHD